MFKALAVINRIVAMVIASSFCYMFEEESPNAIYCKEGTYVCRFGCKTNTGIKSKTFGSIILLINHMNVVHERK